MAPSRPMSNGLMRQALVAIEEVMGENGLKAVLNTSGLGHYIGNLPPNDMEPALDVKDYAKLVQAIEDFYGRGARGFLERIGKASFEYGVREQAALMGLAGVALKVMPQKQRISFVFNAVANALKKTNEAVQAYVEEVDGKIIYSESSCGICEGRTSSEPICHIYVGSLAEAVRWATGNELAVTETHCKAKGDEYCRFEVDSGE